MSACLARGQRVYNDWISWSLPLLVLFAGCGVVGPPVAPEDVGVTPIIEKQKRQQAGQDHPEQIQPLDSSDPASTDGLERPVQEPEIEVPPLGPREHR